MNRRKFLGVLGGGAALTTGVTSYQFITANQESSTVSKRDAARLWLELKYGALEETDTARQQVIDILHPASSVGPSSLLSDYQEQITELSISEITVENDSVSPADESVVRSLLQSPDQVSVSELIQAHDITIVSVSTEITPIATGGTQSIQQADQLLLTPSGSNWTVIL